MGRKNRQQRRKAQETGPSKSSVVLLIILAVFVIFAITIFEVAGKAGEVAGSTTKPTATPVPQKNPPQAEKKEIRAILEEIDTANKTLQVYSIEDAEVLKLNYTSSTDIRDKYRKVIVAGQLSIGDILEITYEVEGLKATVAYISTEPWEYVKRTGLSLTQGRDIMSVNGQNYFFTETLHVYDGISRIDLDAISKEDSFTMLGIGKEVYVVLLTKGHGYLSLEEDQDYIGGSLFLGLDYISQITEGMVLEVTEGTYNVTLENEDLTAKLTAVIRRGETTVLDLSEFVRVPEPCGQVTFRIQPDGAVLWLNDEITYYGEPVELDYGVYQMKVESGGYISYEGTLIVDDAARTITIVLPENKGDEPEDDPGKDGDSKNDENPGGADDPKGDNPNEDGPEEDSNKNPNNGNNGDNPDNTSENPNDEPYKTDDDHYIIIHSDDEVEVYLDGDYMGVTEDGEAVFEKFIGTFTIELVKGNESKKYIIQVDDDGEDFEFSRYFE